MLLMIFLLLGFVLLLMFYALKDSYEISDIIYLLGSIFSLIFILVCIGFITLYSWKYTEKTEIIIANKIEINKEIIQLDGKYIIEKKTYEYSSFCPEWKYLDYDTKYRVIKKYENK